ncbi:hypothetical protein BYT27DRAFT_7083022 [Phlegmacium glaucopus]|nr:hypothetical protein BYT27DRAFT_7083022 [Phlegmacium glaucopus]
MLAWRAISRPATSIRQGSLLQRRLIHPSRSLGQLQAFPRPNNTLLTKLRFRADGKPRSKLIALAFGSLILFNLLTLLTLFDVVEDGELALGLLASIIYIQQTDITYDSINFEDPISTLSYFKKLYQSFSRASEEEVDQLFKDLTRLMKREGSSKSAEVEAQQIMRSAAEKIHIAFRELNQDSISNTANFVFLVLKEAVESLIDLVQDSEDDDDSDTKYTFQLIRDHTKKDAGVLKDYEVLG